ncbi:MAG TPA: helix-turn-helix domain-containing protein [Pyrinomonadaceae bacterium]|jgi:transcriptional regulator with XRE-family HTH domain|nr:helix-turn-helix domain-containing protein [Pyrinomonadaceae bacterium]
MATFEERLVRAFGGANLKQVAEKMDVKYHTLRNWAKETRDIPPSALRQIAKLTNISLNWLLLEQGEMRPDKGQLEPSLDELLETKIREILREREQEIDTDEVSPIEPVESGDTMLAPIVAHIGPAEGKPDKNRDIEYLNDEEALPRRQKKIS